MHSPFPGMNPYLENPELWSEVHHRLITALADAIESNLSLKYRVTISFIRSGKPKTCFKRGLGTNLGENIIFDRVIE